MAGSQLHRWLFKAPHHFVPRSLLGVLLLTLAVVTVPRAQAAHLLYATTTSNRLVQFAVTDPCTIISRLQVTGLERGEALLGIDFRPATGQLYGLGSSSRIYVIDVQTAVATPVGTVPFSPLLEGSAFGFDFNPVVDRIRIVSDTGQNLRANPDTGTVVAVDGPLAYAPMDGNVGMQPGVVGAAYTNPDTDPATGTALYDIDAALESLATQNPPNAGTLNAVGALGQKINDLVGFDITSAGTAYAALKGGSDGSPGPRCGNSQLVTINLTTGSATTVGAIGTREPILGLAAPIPTP